MKQVSDRPIRAGSRPGKNWCRWLDAILQWTPEQRQEAREKADRAYCSKSIRAQYAAAGELGALKAVDEGNLIHQDRCVSRDCPHRKQQLKQ